MIVTTVEVSTPCAICEDEVVPTYICIQKSRKFACCKGCIDNMEAFIGIKVKWETKQVSRALLRLDSKKKIMDMKEWWNSMTEEQRRKWLNKNRLNPLFARFPWEKLSRYFRDCATIMRDDND